MAVEAIDVVVSALAAGGVAGVKDAATAAVKDAYAELVALVRHRFGRPKAEELVAIASAPTGDEQDIRTRLAAALADVALAADDELVAAARTVLAHTDPAGISAGKYTVDARGAQGVQVGDHNTMTLNLDRRDRG